MFEFYVLNYDINKKKVVNYNIFNNIRVLEETEKAVKRYIRSPKNFKYTNLMTGESEFGFKAFCHELRSIIQWQEWCRVEYEIGVCDVFEEDCSKIEKWDCFSQCAPNIEMIAREVIYQYKNQKKLEREK